MAALRRAWESLVKELPCRESDLLENDLQLGLVSSILLTSLDLVRLTIPITLSMLGGERTSMHRQIRVLSRHRSYCVEVP